MSKTSKILIVGAGIGGLCAASALAQIGVDVDVIEIKPENTVPGVGFGLRTNALRALREIGLYDQCLSIGFPSPSLTYYDRYGDHVVELPFGRQIDGMPNNVLLPRLGFLEIATARALELGCTLRMSTTIADLEQDATGVSVTFNDGTSGRYDLVIGFDGIKSQIRQELFGREYDPVPSGGVAWRTALPAPEGLKAPIFCQGTGREGRVRAACRRHDVHVGHPFRIGSTSVRSRPVPATHVRTRARHHGRFGLHGRLHRAGARLRKRRVHTSRHRDGSLPLVPGTRHDHGRCRALP